VPEIGYPMAIEGAIGSLYLMQLGTPVRSDIPTVSGAVCQERAVHPAEVPMFLLLFVRLPFP
jgi:hypothetical protein